MRMGMKIASPRVPPRERMQGRCASPCIPLPQSEHGEQCCHSALRLFLFASMLLLFLVPFASASGMCAEGSLGSVTYDSGQCLNRQINGQGNGYSACRQYYSQTVCEIECTGCTWTGPPTDMNCEPLQPPAGDQTTHSCSLWNDNQAACQAREASAYMNYYGCEWLPGPWHGICGANEGDNCDSNYVNPPAGTCCKVSAPICANDPLLGYSVCATCIPSGSSTQCTGASQGNCCAGLECDSSSHLCIPPSNNPPAKPSTPVIKPLPTMGQTDAAECETSPQGCIVPSDPDPPDTVSLEYQWERKKPGEISFSVVQAWSSAGQYVCSPSECPEQTKIRLEIRGRDSRGLAGAASDPSSPTTVAVPAPPSVCSTDQFNQVLSLSTIGAIATAVLIALAYMAGEFFQNARVLTWAKTEALQIFVSIIVVVAIIAVIGTFCSLQIGEIGAISTSLPQIYTSPSPHQDASIYDAARIYLENLMQAAHTNMKGVRYSLGAYEIRTSYTKSICDGNCWINLSGYDEAAFGGETLNLALTNNMLSISTVSYFTAAFEYFTLLYILNGLFLVFLPIAIVIRSIPFMRQLGGALVGIFVALYFFYPLMLVFDSVITTGIANYPVTFWDTTTESGALQCPGIEVYGSGAACLRTDTPEANLDRDTWQVTNGIMPAPISIMQQIRTNSLIFVSTVFLAAFNFIVIAAMGRGITHFLGEEADISRLGQMI